ncbi:MAG: CotH kinase family protein [Muribaculaceae bacterium]|nr:CotH kinase family protein [Muribaculaceae bacterium]
MKNLFTLIKVALASALVCCFATGANASEKALPQMRITYTGALNNSDYIPGTLLLTAVDGTEWNIPNALFRTRGATALNYSMKPSLNMKLRDELDEELDTELLGLRKASSFILDAMAIDRINMRNRVAFDIWNSFSRLPYETDFGSRNGTVGAFVEMYINGEYKGIYCLTDKINRKLLDLKKPEVDDNGNVTIRGALYKHGTNDEGCDQNTPGFYNDYIDYTAKWHDAWELHEPEDYASPEAWAPLTELYENSNYSNYEYVKEHFWLENLADYTIHVMALAIVDNWGNKNKYFSVQNMTKNGDKRRFVVTPWDLDTSLGGEYDGSKYDGNYTTWAVSDVAKNAPLPFGACLAQQEFKNLLRQRWIEGSLGAFAVDSVKQRLFDNCRLFIESGAWQRTIDYWNTQKYSEKYVDDLEKEVSLIAQWYENRFKKMDEYFGITDEERAGFADVNIIVTDNDITRPRDIYNMQGVLIRRNASDDTIDNLPPGLYIIAGQKTLIK